MTTFREVRKRSNAVRSHSLSICLSGVAAWILSIISIEIYRAIGRAADIKMSAGAPGAHSAQQISVINFAEAISICMVLGVLLALVVARFARKPARTFVIATVVLVGVSLSSPLGASHARLSTKIFLAVGHLMVAAIVIPILTRRLPGDREREMSQQRGSSSSGKQNLVTRKS